MKSLSTLGKAFEINQNANIYGTFAEIGAGQETVNFFYKAGIASQTIAKSMSAYDMTVSDEIYGKQNRYVCKDRLVTILNRECQLLERRLKNKQGDKTCFFAFATTAATSSQSKSSSQSHHAWMGLRFQTKPLQAFNDVMFHVNCLDKNRLQQHEALGILGVNLIYACFKYYHNPKNFISALKDNLSGSRIKINTMMCLGPSFKKFSASSCNMELLSQQLSNISFFSSEKTNELLSDACFSKSICILHGDDSFINEFQKHKSQYLKYCSLQASKTCCIAFIPTKQLSKSKSVNHVLKQLCAKDLSVLITSNIPLEGLTKQLKLYKPKSLVFIVSEDYFKKHLFDPSFYKDYSVFQALGRLFDKKTKLMILSKDKTFCIKTEQLKFKQENLLKNYLIQKNLIENLKSI